MTASVLDGFFTTDPAAIERALAALHEPRLSEITTHECLDDDTEAVVPGGPCALGDRWGVVTCARPLVHPASGVRVERVPITPASRRPLGRGVGGHPIPGPLNRRIERFLYRNHVLGRLVELGSKILADDAHESLQTELARLHQALTSTGDDPEWEPIVDELPGLGLPADRLDENTESDADPRRPLGAAFAGTDRLLVKLPDWLVVLSRADGRVLARHATPPTALVGVSPDGTRALLRDLVLTSHYLVRLADGGFETDLAGGFPLRLVVENNEISWLVDAATQRARRLTEIVGFPLGGCLSPDGGYYWSADRDGAGGIFALATGERQLSAAWLGAQLGDTRCPRLKPDGGLTRARETEAQFDPEARASDAIALGRDGRWRTSYVGVINVDGEPLFALPRGFSVAGFAEGGEELVVAGKNRVLVVHIGTTPKIVASFALASPGAKLRSR